MDLSSILGLIRELPEYQAIHDSLAAGQVAPQALALPRAARPTIAAVLSLDLRRSVVLVVSRPDRLLTLSDEIPAWAPELRLLSFPDPRPLFYERAYWGPRTLCQRVVALTTLTTGQVPGGRGGLDDELGVCRAAGAPAGELDVDLAVGVRCLVAPGEEPQDHVRIQGVHRGCQGERVRAVAVARGADDLGTCPSPGRVLRDLQVEIAAVHPDVHLAEDVRTRPDGAPACLDGPRRPAPRDLVRVAGLARREGGRGARDDEQGGEAERAQRHGRACTADLGHRSGSSADRPPVWHSATHARRARVPDRGAATHRGVDNELATRREACAGRSTQHIGRRSGAGVIRLPRRTVRHSAWSTPLLEQTVRSASQFGKDVEVPRDHRHRQEGHR